MPRSRIARAALAVTLLLALAYGGYRGFLAYLYARIVPAALPPSPPVRGLASRAASGCAECHRDIYDEWRGSLHGQAMTDRFFRVEYEEQHRIFACLRCHAPLHEQQPTIVTGLARIAPARPRETNNPDYDEALHAEGVTCLACHQRGDALAGPLPFEPSATPHAVTVDPAFGANELCVRCHAALAFPFSKVLRPVLPTFVEHDDYRRAGGRLRCVECHMSPVERAVANGAPVRKGRRHALLGVRDREFLRAHLAVSLPRCQAAGASMTCTVALTNGAGHRFPTGEPGRELVVELAPLSGAEPARHSILRRMDRIDLVEKPGEDNTLLPAETREVRVTAPAPARLRVRFCAYERGDPLLLATRTEYDALCLTLAEVEVDAKGAARPVALPEAASRRPTP